MGVCAGDLYIAFLRITRLTVVLEEAGDMLLRSERKVFMALTGLFLVVDAADMLLATLAALVATTAALFAIIAALRAMDLATALAAARRLSALAAARRFSLRLAFAAACAFLRPALRIRDIPIFVIQRD